MGSLCGSGTQRTTTNSSSTTTPFAQSQIQDIYGVVRDAASTPFTPYGGQFTASLSPTQQAGISNINAAYGTAQPYLNTAAQYATQGASAIDPNQIERYFNPYTASVIDATRANFNEQNAIDRTALKGDAISMGALGGDRTGVAQAELMRKQKLAQDPVIANLQAQGYRDALAAAQADRTASQYGAGAFSGLGTTAQNALLQGAQAQLGAGGIEQATQQAQLDAAYKEFLRQQQNPYMNAQFLAQYGLPAATAQGQSTTGNQVQERPGASPLNSILGLGTAALGAFSGNPMMALGGLGGLFGGGSLGAGEYGGPIGGSTYSIGYGGQNMPVFGFSSGGRTDDFMATVNAIRDGLRKNRGGSVLDMRRDGIYRAPFANGGLADRFSAVEEAIAGGTFDPQGPNYTAFNAAPFAVPQSTSPLAPLANAAPRVQLPPEIIGPQDEEEPQAMAFSPYDRAPSPLPMVNRQAPQNEGTGLFGLSDRARMALIHAGLGMAASQAPNVGQAIGEGGLAGLKSYAQSVRDEREAEEVKERKELQRQRVDMEAKRLQQSAEQFAKTHGLAERREGRAEREEKEAKDRGKWQYLGPSDDGKSSVFMNTVTGEHEERAVKVAPKGGSKPRQMNAGDIRKLTEEGNKFQQINGFVDTFKPEYAGAPFVGKARNWVGRTLPDSMVDESVVKGATWWQEYDRYKNQVRNELFGSALTATEKAAFEAADINPGMSADAIKRNLAAQQRAVQSAMSKLGGALVSEGYNPETISKAYGLPADHFKGGDKTSSKPQRPSVVPEGSAYSPSRKQWRAPDGTLFDESGNRVKS